MLMKDVANPGDAGAERVEIEKKVMEDSFPNRNEAILVGIQKKNLVFILHFRPLGTFLIFTKKLKFCQYFYFYFWE